MGIKVLSLFDGISCGRVALERAGIDVDRYDAYEIDCDAISVSKKNYPEIEHHGDVFSASYREGEHDILIGGSPCTYWSIAKAGGERETTASGFGWELFSQYVRAYREAKPRFFLYENNSSMSDEIRQCITRELGIEPIEIDSADFSAQHRKRLYWTNIPIDAWTPVDTLFSDIMQSSVKFKYRDFSKYKDTRKVSDDGMSCRYDTSGKGYYSQANRCKKPDQKWNTIPSSGIDKNDVWVGECLSRHITAVEAERLQTLPDNYTDVLKTDGKRFKGIGNGWTVDVIAHIFKNLKKMF